MYYQLLGPLREYEGWPQLGDKKEGLAFSSLAFFFSQIFVNVFGHQKVFAAYKLLLGQFPHMFNLHS